MRDLLRRLKLWRMGASAGRTGRGECVERDIVEGPIVHGEWRVRGGDARSRSLGPRGCEGDGDERIWK